MALIPTGSPLSSIRLSWPNVEDSRRALVAKPLLNEREDHAPIISGSRFIHLSSCDVEIHYRLITSKNGSSSLPSLSVPLPWNPHHLEVRDKDLLQYCQFLSRFNIESKVDSACIPIVQHTACQALATFGHDAGELGGFLLQMALSNDSASAVALLRLLLTFSSLHLHGNQRHAWEQKISALGTLATAFKGKELDTDEAIQHIASAMMLYSCEVLRASHTSGDWTKYLYGVKEIIDVSLGTVYHDRRDVGSLLDWVYYNDVMARFSLRHWDGESSRILSSPTIIRSMASPASSSVIELLGLLLEIYSAISADTPCIEMSDDYRQFLKILDWKIKSLPKTNPVEEAFQLATLIYLGRASGTLLDEPLRTQQRMERAFLLLSELPSCERQFPVFILGCEARTDKQRAIILDLISRTADNPASRSFNYVKLLLEAIWAQHDLEDRQHQDGDYWRKLNLTMGRCAIPPSFV